MWRSAVTPETLHEEFVNVHFGMDARGLSAKCELLYVDKLVRSDLFLIRLICFQKIQEDQERTEEIDADMMSEQCIQEPCRLPP